jgi:hypothetical protein
VIASFPDLNCLARVNLRCRHQAAPDFRQGGHYRAVAIALDEPFGRHGGQGLLETRKIGEQIVEAAVLRVDDDDGLDRLLKGVVEGAPRCTCRQRNARRQAGCRKSTQDLAPVGSPAARQLGLRHGKSPFSRRCRHHRN